MPPFYSLFRLFITLACFFSFPFNFYGQPANKFAGDVTMPAPNAASLGKYGDVPVSYFTGVPSISIPIHTVQSGPLSLPLSLNYHAGGIRVGEPVSWVGTGWSLNAGGIITRTILNLPDECGFGYKYIAPTLLDPVQTWVDLNNAFNNWDIGTNECPNPNTPPLCSLAYTLSTQLQNANNGQLDTEPDLFTFNVGGYAGKFIMDKDGKFHIIPKSDVKIEYLANPNSPSEWWITQFTLIVPDGTRYIFGRLSTETGRAGLEFNQFDSPPYTSSIAPSSWYLRRVETHDGKFSIVLNYAAENYSYLSLASYTYTYVNGGSSAASTGLVGIAPPYKYANRSNITGWRLTSITSPTETVTFTANTDRTDLDQCFYSTTQFPTSKKALDSIEITSGSFCKRFALQYSYFQDNTNTTPSYSRRLRLNSITEKACNGSIVNPLHQFSYKAGNLINRLSHQVDHWGYFNGKTTNETTSNIPPVTFVDFTGQLFTPPFATANRSTSEQDMLIGMIDTIKYPTGGFTKFTFEANTAMLPSGWTGNGGDGGSSCTTQIVSQSLSNCTYPSSTCCPQSYLSVPDTFSADDLNGAKIRMVLMNLNIAPYQHCNIGNPNPPSAWIRFTIKNAANNNIIFNHEFNLNTSQNEFTYETQVPYTLLPNVAYNLILETKNGKGTAYLFKCGSSGGGGGGSLVETKVGGLRIREIRTHDAVSSANDIVRTYEYKNPASPTGASSGVLYYTPQYVGQALRFNNFALANIVTATSVVPLANFNGNHIAYPFVTELTNGNGKKLVTTISEQGYYYNNKFPYGPDLACVKDGFEKEQRIFDNSNAVKSVSTKYPTTTDAYYNLAGTRYKMSTYTVGGQTTGLFSSYSVATYPIRNAAQRISIVADTVDGVGTQTTYFYDNLNRFLAPVALEVINSDGKITRNENKYIHDYPVTGLRDSLLKRNLISEPFVKTVKVNNLAVSGDSTTYAWFNSSTGAYQAGASNGIPRAYNFYRYEMTWSGGNPTAGSRVLKGTINNYNAQGKIASFTTANWPAAETYVWSASGLIQSRTYQSHTVSYDYYSNTRLLRAITETDGRKTGFVYDNLMRLSKSTKDSTSVNGSGVVIDGKVKTEYTYHFKETADPQNWVKTKNTFAAVSGSGLTTTETFEYLDGLGRPLQTVKKAWSPLQKDVVSAVLYDNQGRVTRQYTPFETATNTGASATVPANQPYTLSQYELSPLNRVLSVTPPGWYPTTTTYGANVANEVGYYNGSSSTSYFPANSLIKIIVSNPQSSTRTIENITYKDKKGRVVMNRRKEVESATNKADTYNIYDDKDRLISVLPPGVSTAASDFNLRFEYVYDAADRMTSKKIPDMAAVNMRYDNRDQPVLTQDGNLLAAGKWMLIKYDAYGRPISSGLHTGANPDPNNASLAFNEQHTATTYGVSGHELGKIKTNQTWIPGGSSITRTYTYSAVTGRMLTDNGANHLTGNTGSDITPSSTTTPETC